MTFLPFLRQFVIVIVIQEMPECFPFDPLITEQAYNPLSEKYEKMRKYYRNAMISPHPVTPVIL